MICHAHALRSLCLAATLAIAPWTLVGSWSVGIGGPGVPFVAPNTTTRPFLVSGADQEHAVGQIIYYSQASGQASDPIWDVVPDGTPGPATFTSAHTAVVQDTHHVVWDQTMPLADLVVEGGGSFTIAADATLQLHGSLQVLGALNGLPGSELALVGTELVGVESQTVLDLWNMTVNAPQGVFTDADVHIRGTLLLNAGELTLWGDLVLVSDAGGTGRLGPVAAAAELNGAITVQRYIPEGSTNWRLLGSAVGGARVLDWKDNFYTAGFPGSHWPEFYDTWNGGWAPGAQHWPSIRRFVEPTQGQVLNDGLVGVESTLTSLGVGQGFSVWCGDTITGTQPFVVDVTGPAHIAKTPLALPVSWTPAVPSVPALEGWNLVSNPLPSPIAFSALARGGDLSAGYYIYDPVSGNNAFWDHELGMSFPHSVLNGTIQSSQAFWVKAHGANTMLTVTEAAKVADEGGGLFGGNEMPMLGFLRLALEHTVNNMRDETVLVFGAGAPELGPEDAMKLHVGHKQAPRIATRSSDGHDLMVNKTGAYHTSMSIPVVMRAAHSGLHTITTHTVNMGLGCWVLEDFVTGVMTPLHDGASYTFEQDSTGEQIIHRFMLHGSHPIGIATHQGTCGPFSGSAELTVPGEPVHVTITTVDGVVVEVVPAAWGTVVIDGLDAGNYTVVVSSTTACVDLVHDLTIINTGTPVDLAVSGPLEAYVSQPLTFAAAAAADATVEWDMGDGTTATGVLVQHTYGMGGTFTVTATGELAECIEVVQHEVQVSTSLGGAPVAADRQRVWYADGAFVVDHTYDHAGPLVIEILDATGRLHAAASVPARPGRVRVPATDLNTGIWFVRIVSVDGPRTVRVPLAR